MTRFLSFSSLIVLGLFSAITFATADPTPTPTPAPMPNTPAGAILTKADKQLEAGNYMDARDLYDKARDLAADWSSPEAWIALKGAVSADISLSLWDDPIGRIQTYIAQNKGKIQESRGERFLGEIYSQFPHYGTKQGGVYHRGEYLQGVRVSSFAKDRKESILHLERARLLAIALVPSSTILPTDVNSPLQDQIGTDFDLVSMLIHHNEYYYGGGFPPFWSWWWGGWSSYGEAEEDSAAVDEADYEQPREFQREQPAPQGLPIDAQGSPRFILTPDAYTATMGDGVKVRFLGQEIQKLDPSASKNDAARALLDQGEIDRSLYGPDGVNAFQPRYDRLGRPLPAVDNPQIPKKIWELADDEAITLVAGKPRLITLPTDESPLAVFEQVATKYPNSNLVAKALFEKGSYYQNRQQFPQAQAAYKRMIEAFSSDKQQKELIEQAKAQINNIERPGVVLTETPTFLPDANPKIKFNYRNLGTVHVSIHKFNYQDLVATALDDKDQNEFYSACSPNQLVNQDEKDWKHLIGDEVTSWDQTVPTNDKNQTAEGEIQTALNTPGFYLVEATAKGASQPSRVLVWITGTAIVQKDLVNKGLIWVVDAKTGQPLPNQKIRVIETWTEWNNNYGTSHFKVESEPAETNLDGVVEYKRHEHGNYQSNVSVIIDKHDDYVFSALQEWNDQASDDNGFENGERQYIITDRPVYRPGSVVKFRIWDRQRNNGLYLQPKQYAGNIYVTVIGPKGDQVFAMNKNRDENGCLSGEYTLPADAPLGLYSINNSNGGYPYAAGGQFRVEEYKKPEFEVKVVPTKTQEHLGDKVTAKITARYYFGAPVSKGTVKYKVFREDYHYIYWGADEYDWLYGAGYGRCYYSYPWFSWWYRWGGFIIWDDALYGYYGPGGTGMGADDAEMNRRSEESGTRHALRDLVAQGEAELRPDGTYDVEIDTAPALKTMGDRDHRYTIEAEVRDASRRTITGQGDIKVTRQEFYGFCEVDRGWYQAHEDAKVDIRTLTPDDVPVATKGTVTVSKITYEAGSDVPKEEPVKSFPGETDVDGRLSFTFTIPDEGQYRITYSTRDSTNSEVQANAIFWAWGPHFDGSVYRFNNLEIISDKRTYQPGETAHLLINTSENNTRVLFSDNASQSILRNYKFLDLPQRSTQVDVPITDASEPNFFVEATLVKNGHVHQETREMFVPPSKNLLNVTLHTDKPEYKPGEVGHIRVEMKDALGNPAKGQITLTTYDKAVTYIQDEFGPSPKVFFYGQRRQHNQQYFSNLDLSFYPFGSIDAPENEVSSYYFDMGASGGAPGALDDMAANGTVSGSAMNGIAPMAMMSPRGGMAKAASLEAREKDDAYSREPSDKKRALGGEAGNPPDNQSEAAHPAIRQNFADTALWLPDLETDDTGVATADITFPDSLTTWRLHGYCLTLNTQVGDGTTETVTTKKLLVRLEAPRFFVERDEVVLSSNVHNYLTTAKNVNAEITVPAAQFESLEQPDLKPDADGNIHLTAQASIDSNGEHRFNWPLKVVTAGLAKVTTKALTDEESDAMEMTFPVLVHGIDKTVAQNGSYRVDVNGSRDIALDLPKEIDPEQTKLEVTLCPSLGGVMIDALPYLIGYPYGCTEQTMDRFYPAVLVRDSLRKMGTDLETIGKQRKQMNEQDLKNRFKQPDVNPIYSTSELDNIVDASIDRLKAFQHGDGGWGWWRDDDSSDYQTAYVLQGLIAARDAGVRDDGMINRGQNFLANYIETELQKPKDKQELPDLVSQAYYAYILNLCGDQPTPLRKAWMDELYAKRGDMNRYGQALLALLFKKSGQEDRAQLLLQNMMQFLARDDSNETAWVRTPDEGWWFWYNNDIETNAWVLKALVAIDPKSDISPRIVKWLLNNRKNGYYWRSTRDTAQVIGAMVDYMRASGEANPDYDLTVKLDGQEMKKVHVNKDNFFTFDNRLVLYGLQVQPGPHTLTIEKNGAGALYYSSYLTYFTKEEDIKGAGNEIEIVRDYYQLKPKTEKVVVPDNGNPAAEQTQPDAATGHTELRDEWERIPLHNGDAVTSGEEIEVVLKIHAKNTYDYLAFEDMKPAGCETVDIRSGGKFAGGLCPNVELRDTKTVFFIGLLEQGDHILRYKMRAEVPGTFHALPTKGYAMYAPEVKAISDEMKLKINDDGK